MPFTLPPLPYAKDALAPHTSAETLDFHHGKHHAAYVNKLNELTAGKPEAEKSLEDLIKATDVGTPIFNNAAQVWNHDFFWESIAPNGGGTPPEPVAKRIDAAFGSLENFRDKFVDAAVEQFGSGWAWLVSRGGKLEIVTTHDADNPLTTDAHALWTCDVWEHAYYLDYQQERAQFVKAVIDNVANWQFVGKRLAEGDHASPRVVARSG